MHMAGDLGHVEMPPLERAALEVKMQIGILLSMHRDGAMDVGDWGLAEAVRFNRAGDVRADGARDDHGWDRAEAVGQVDLLRQEVRAEAVRAELLRAALELGTGKLEKTVGVLERGLEAVGGFAAKCEIGQRHAPFESSPLRVMPTAPNLGVNHRRLGECEVIESLLLPWLQQRAQGPQIERAANVEIEVLGAVVGFEHGIEPSFGPRDLQVGQTPDHVRVEDMRLGGSKRHA